MCANTRQRICSYSDAGERRGENILLDFSQATLAETFQRPFQARLSSMCTMGEHRGIISQLRSVWHAVTARFPTDNFAHQPTARRVYTILTLTVVMIIENIPVVATLHPISPDVIAHSI